jgi:hypothetical protein
VRTLASGQTTAVAQPNVAAVIFVEMDFASGFLRLNTSGYDLPGPGGNTYQGVGQIGEIQAIREAEGGEISGLAFSISGVPSSYITTVLAEQYQGRACNVYVGFLDLPAYTMTDAPVAEWSGRMDVLSIQDDSGTSKISVTAEHELFDFDRPLAVMWSDEEQQRRFPGDLGLQYISQMSDRQIIWPAANFDLIP